MAHVSDDTTPRLPADDQLEVESPEDVERQVDQAIVSSAAGVHRSVARCTPRPQLSTKSRVPPGRVPTGEAGRVRDRRDAVPSVL